MSRKPRFSAAEALNLIFQVPGDGQESDNSDFSGEEGGLSEENSDSDGEFMLSDDDLNDNADIHGDVGQPIVQWTGENPAVQINGGAVVVKAGHVEGHVDGLEVVLGAGVEAEVGVRTCHSLLRDKMMMFLTGVI